MKPAQFQATLALLLVLSPSCVVCFEFPDIASVFSPFYKNSASDGANADSEVVKDRVKRQNANIGDESTLPHIIKSSSLPMKRNSDEVNERYMPTLGNGHLATTVFTNAIYLNGLYAGEGGESHRVAIPARILGRVRVANEEVDERATKKFILNGEEGYFAEEIDCEFAKITHKIYIHKYLIRVVVSEISMAPKNSQIGGGKIIIDYPGMNVSQDILWGKDLNHHAHIHINGRTVSAEEGADKKTVHMFRMDVPDNYFVQPSDSGTKYFTSIMSIDREEANARSEFDEAIRILSERGGHNALFRMHSEAWKDEWKNGRVEVFGDKQLAKLTFFSQYYLLSSLPSLKAKQPPQHKEFVYGVSRTSLAKGGKVGKDYQGHVMWDNEMYILPPLMLFQPKLVKEALRYRTEMLASAKEIAESMGAEGAKFPFRSAFTGKEVSPGDCPKCENSKFHTSAAVSFAIRQYFSVTRDRDYLVNDDYRGCDIVQEIAKFYASQSKYHPETARYSMGRMTGPDETYPDRNNNAYTIVAASLAIHYARYIACTCQRNEREEVPEEWVQMAMYYDLPYDNVQRKHEQFEGFLKMPDARVSQADTILITYPLNWNVSRDIMRHDLEFYEGITSERSPAMTWSFFTIGWKWVEETQQIKSFFQKSYQEYVISPFKIWTEFSEGSATDQEEGSVNFLPGMGGFLQSLIYGFVGIRIRPEMLEFHRPEPPPDCDSIRLVNMQYLGTVMTIEVTTFSVTIEVHEEGDYPLVLRRNDSTFLEETLRQYSFITIDKPETGFYIFTNVRSGCEHPRDYIYMPWGYSPFVDAASDIRASALVTTVLGTLSLFTTRFWGPS